MNKKTLETALGVTSNYRRQDPDLKTTNLAGKSSGAPRRQKRTNPAWELQTKLKQFWAFKIGLKFSEADLFSCICHSPFLIVSQRKKNWKTWQQQKGNNSHSFFYIRTSNFGAGTEHSFSSYLPISFFFLCDLTLKTLTCS